MKKKMFENELISNFKKLNKALCKMNVLNKKIDSKISENLNTIENVKESANTYIENMLKENKEIEMIKDKNLEMLNTIKRIIDVEE